MRWAAPDKHLPELDGVRGIACLLVVVMHCFTTIMARDWQMLMTSYFPGLGTILTGGVDLFFVLSGFLIGGILLDSRKASNFFRVFWVRRAARILPVYILLLYTYFAASAVRPMLDVPWMDEWLLKQPSIPLWSYATFTQNYVMAAMANPGAFWMGITWSLAVEEQFYLAFPLLVYILRKRTLVLLALASLVVAALLRTYLWNVSGKFYVGYFPTPARVDALMFGFLVTCVVRDPSALSFFSRYRMFFDALALVGLAVILAGAMGLDMSTLNFSVLSAVFAYAILRNFIVKDGWYRAILRTPFLVQIGFISYALYMYHQAVNGLLHGLVFQHPPAITNWKEFGVACLVVLVSASLATLSTRFYEMPLRNWARRMRYVFDVDARLPVPTRNPA
jgi:peptidoglycan/LPS O-acetylase OafA/YrhL